MKYKIGMVSLGCPKNLCDTENMLGILASEGHSIVSDPDKADIIIVNTCAFIGDAKEESIDKILEMAQYKKGNCKCLIAAGCLAQRYKDEIPTQIPEIDAIVGTMDYDKIADIVDRAMSGKKEAYCRSKDVPEGLPRILTTPYYSAYLKISEGCDNCCTYCIIPKLRGRYQSRQMEDIVSEAERLAEAGVRELILIAQDTTRYGIDLYKKFSLAQLVDRLCKIEKIQWVRLHYLYPEAVTDELIDVIANNQKACKYIDIPLQHASNKVLKRMNRRNTKEQAEELIYNIRSKMPNATIRTTFIVGFPGETEEDFKELVEFTEKMKFDRVGAFAYSAEEGTAAAEFIDQVSEDQKACRKEQLMGTTSKIIINKNKDKEGSIIKVLCEGYDDEAFLYYGRSEADSIDIDTKVYFAAEREVKPGEFVLVKILCTQDFDLVGEEAL